MAIYCTYFGIDSHLRTTTICAPAPEDGELRTRTFKGNDYGEMAEWMAGFPQPSHGVCESGCTGFVPARMPARGRGPVPTRHVAGRAHADRQARGAPVPAPPGPAAPRRPGRCRVAGDCLAALSAAESAEVAHDGPGARAEGVARAPARGRPSTHPCARGARGLPSALAFAAEAGGLSRPSSGRKAASHLGLAPSGAERRGPGTGPRHRGAASCAGLSSRVPGSSRGATRRAARGAGRRCPSRSASTRGPARGGSSDVAGSWSPEARCPARPTPPRPPRWRACCSASAGTRRRPPRRKRRGAGRTSCGIRRHGTARRYVGLAAVLWDAGADLPSKVDKELSRSRSLPIDSVRVIWGTLSTLCHGLSCNARSVGLQLCAP